MEEVAMLEVRGRVSETDPQSLDAGTDISNQMRKESLPLPLLWPVQRNASRAELAVSTQGEDDVRKGVVECKLLALASHQFWGTWAILQVGVTQ